jgi:dienelactone hydrolase
MIPATLKAYPSEQMQNATVSYASVETRPGVRLRTIVSVPVTPSKDRYPAVLLVQGGGCGSIDTPIGTPVAQPGLMHFIGSRGFVTMRVEKSGVGDSQGEPCASIGFADELAGYQAALRALQSHPAVDRERVYLVGISLGGLFAPLLAAETRVAGISVFGTPAGPTPAYPGRSDRFFQEMAKVDFPTAWAKVHTRVQVLHGEYDVDPVINRAAHESIAAIVNRANSGTAQFQELESMDHCWTRHASLEASKDKCGQGQETGVFQEAVLRFLSRIE